MSSFVLIFFLGLMLSVDNSELVSLKFLGFHARPWPISWWMLVAFIIGTVLGYLISLISILRLKIKLKTATKSDFEK